MRFKSGLIRRLRTMGIILFLIRLLRIRQLICGTWVKETINKFSLACVTHAQTSNCKSKLPVLVLHKLFSLREGEGWWGGLHFAHRVAPWRVVCILTFRAGKVASRRPTLPHFYPSGLWVGCVGKGRTSYPRKMGPSLPLSLSPCGFVGMRTAQRCLVAGTIRRETDDIVCETMSTLLLTPFPFEWEISPLMLRYFIAQGAPWVHLHLYLPQFYIPWKRTSRYENSQSWD